MNMSSDGMSTMSLSVAADLFLYAAPPNYFLNNFLHLKARCFQAMHLVRADAFGQGYCTWLKSSPKCLICFHILILQVLLSILFNQD
jgi:hypothetical protein